MSRHNGHPFGKKQGNRHPQVTQTPDPGLSPEMDLRRRALMRLAILPPYQSVMPQRLTLEGPGGEQKTREIPGLTKREHMVGMFIAAMIQKDGPVLTDAEMGHRVRLATMQSEMMFQTLSKMRGDDTESIMRDIEREDEQAQQEKDAQDNSTSDSSKS